jgi:hypothetical protein
LRVPLSSLARHGRAAAAAAAAVVGGVLVGTRGARQGGVWGCGVSEFGCLKVVSGIVPGAAAEGRRVQEQGRGRGEGGEEGGRSGEQLPRPSPLFGPMAPRLSINARSQTAARAAERGVPDASDRRVRRRASPVGRGVGGQRKVGASWAGGARQRERGLAPSPGGRAFCATRPAAALPPPRAPATVASDWSGRAGLRGLGLRAWGPAGARDELAGAGSVEETGERREEELLCSAALYSPASLPLPLPSAQCAARLMHPVLLRQRTWCISRGRAPADGG